MLARFFVSVALFAMAMGHVVQVDDPSQNLPSYSYTVNGFPDETEINHPEEKIRSIAVERSRRFDTSTCPACGMDEDYEKNQHNDPISCKCVRRLDGKIMDDIKVAETTREVVNRMFGRPSRARGFTSVQQLYWPRSSDGKVYVPYILDSNLPDNYKRVIENAINEFRSKSCIRFVLRGTQKDYLIITKKDGCWSFIGKTGGGQELSIGENCHRLGIVEHELMHALGFFHEQSRPDRDSHVTIQLGNVIQGFENNFEKQVQIDSGGSPYDVGSVMHYGEYAFSKNRQKTIVVRSNPNNVKVGQRDGFSVSDLQQINQKYCGGGGGGGGSTTTTPRTTTTTRTTTSTRPTTTTTTTVQPSGNCRDLESDRNCRYWAGQRYCTRQYVAFMKLNCKRTCGLCSGVTPPVATVCKDKIRSSQCKQFNVYCDSVAYGAWMKKYCPSTCRACISSETTTSTTKMATTTIPRVRVINSQRCGRPAIQENSYARIVGGMQAKPGTIPWQVSIRFGGSRAAICGGSLIAKEWILTAAHCVRPKHLQYYNVFVGLHKKKPGSDNGEHHKLVKVAQVIRHPGYNDKTMENDIALLRLQEPVQYTNYISPVCLADNSIEPSPGESVTVSGWGDMTETGTAFQGHNEFLMKVDLEYIDRDRCNRWMKGVGEVHNNMLCAGYRQGGRDSCQGDSGGPLTFKKNSVYYQIGVVSWGEGCAKEMKPGVYARVSYFREWIKEVAGL